MAFDFPGEREVWYWPYRLRARGFVNAISGRREFEGALIRVGGGYGCLHPWEELGDPALGVCLEDLKGRRFWPIVRRALRCAQFDEAAREREESLFEEMEVPVSHATLTEVGLAGVEKAREAGFDYVKVKGGRDLGGELEFLREAVERFPEVRWRVDFNESLDGDGLRRFFDEAGGRVLGAIDFLEDPLPFSEDVWGEAWRRHGVRLAVDMEAGPGRRAAQVMVIKPAVDEPFLLGEAAMAQGQKVVVTSYMDHPLGQVFAAYEAARTEAIFPGLVGVCGLQTHTIFQGDEFTEQLGEWGPEFTVPGGTGLGFDDVLRGLPWKRL